MQNELLGWMKLIRYLVLWCGSWWVISTNLTDFAQWSAMPQGTVLTIIIGVISFWVTSSFVAYIERKFFGYSQMYDTDTNGKHLAKKPVGVSARPYGNALSGYCNCPECRAARAARGLADDPRYWNGEV